MGLAISGSGGSVGGSPHTDPKPDEPKNTAKPVYVAKASPVEEDDPNAAKSRNMLVVGLCVLLIFATLGLGYYGFSSSDSYESKMADYTSQAKALKSSIKSLRLNTNTAQKDAAMSVHTAADAGKSVADLQNKYFSMTTGGTTKEEQSQNNATIVENAKQIGKYLSSGDDQNARTPWFPTLSEKGSVNPEWKFLSTYSFSDNAVGVVWACYDDTSGNLLSYTTATYNVDKKVFSGVQYAQNTSFGNNVIATSNNTTSKNVNPDMPSDADNNKAMSKAVLDNLKQELACKPNEAGCEGNEKNAQDLAKARDELAQKQQKEQNDKVKAQKETDK